MTRGGQFYAIYDNETGFWTKSKPKAIELIDQQVREYAEKDAGPESMADQAHGPVIQYMADSANMLVTQFERFCKTMGENWKALDQKMLFSNSEVKRTDYASKTLDYPLQETPIPYYEALCSVLYLPDEQEKWEWAVGSMITGDSTKIQKMFAFYGEPGTGKSTIISKVFADQVFGGIDMGYAVKFEANNVVGGDSFGTDFLENDSVLVYDDDAEMDMITCRSTLNKIISHEQVRVNCKFKAPYNTTATCMIFVGSNDPIQLSPNSGMKRRLIDIRPTGNLLDADTYDECIAHIPFEKSGIAWKCLQVYKKLGKHHYDHYIAEDMLARTSPFHNFVTENVLQLKDGISLAAAYDLYLKYAETCKFKNVSVRYKFRDTLKLYYDTYDDAKFSNFRWEKIGKSKPEPIKLEIESWLKFGNYESCFDKEMLDCPAQYTNDKESPLYSWDKCKTSLRDIDTSKLHYVRVPEKHIVIDFDIKGEDGNKSFEKNLEAASKFPPTYAELSKSGSGIHLHYIYTGGDPAELSREYDDNIEVKVFTGKSSLRRKLTLCNTLAFAVLNSGLPKRIVKGGNKMVDWDGFEKESVIKSMIVKNLEKGYHSSTKSSCDYIYEILTQAYRSGCTYDAHDLMPNAIMFAKGSTNHADYCVDLMMKAHWRSKDIEDAEKALETIPNKNVDEDAPIIFWDVEVAPSYKQAKALGVDIPQNIPEDTPAAFIICWKFRDNEPWIFKKNGKLDTSVKKEVKSVNRMINPKPEEIEKLFKYRMIGFNNRSYDNHMTWAAAQGYTAEELYDLNCRIIANDKTAKFGQAWQLSDTDIFDFASSGNKQGLKKFEIQFGADHVEWDKPWDCPVAVDDLVEFADYCTNDVISTEITFDYLQDDYEARLILSKMSGLTPNDTTNSHTTEILTKGISNPQDSYIYTDLSTIFPGYEYSDTKFPKEKYDEGAKIVSSHSYYMGEDPGEGGYANCPKPGIYYNVGLFDVASMHPHSAIKLKIFGEEITKRFENIVEGRVAVKHIKEIGDDAYKEAVKLLGPIIEEVFQGVKPENVKKKAKAVANALKTAINSVYGLTSASFPNKLRDPRNKDNIVAKYGALFMITLKHKVEEMGYTVVHIKTDSIKIANTDDKIEKFVMDFGKAYGYTFEHEATYSKICIIDDAQYIAYEVEADGEKLDQPFWTATGAKFAAPYLFKSLFTHEEIEFDDYPITKSVSKGALYLVYDNRRNFIGRVGSFIPVVDGGQLMRVDNGKDYAATGTKGYLWDEAARIKDHPERIDKDYYRKQCDDAIETINQFGDFDEFVGSLS